VIAITKVRFLRVSWVVEPAQLIVAARMGELGREAPPRTERRNPASAFRGGVLLLDTQLPVAERGLRCRWPTFCAPLIAACSKGARKSPALLACKESGAAGYNRHSRKPHLVFRSKAIRGAGIGSRKKKKVADTCYQIFGRGYFRYIRYIYYTKSH